MSRLTEELSALAGQWIVRTTYPSVPVGPTPVQIVGYDPLRWGLVISAAQSNTQSAWPDPAMPPTAGLFDGLNLLPVMLAYRDWGGLVQAAWYASNPSGPGTADYAVIEVVLQQ